MIDTDFNSFINDTTAHRPDLLISLNFTGLREPNAPDMKIYPRRYVEVYVGLTDDRKKVLRSTEPTQLVPGANLIGFADWFIRQRLRRRSLATLGFEVR